MPLTAEDHLAILNLASRYAQTIDLGDPKGYADCFTEDGVFDARPVTLSTGHDELEAFAAASQGGARHWMGNPVVDGDGDAATMTQYLMIVYPGAESKTGVTGVYRDQLVKQNGAWKIKHRKLTFEEPPQGFE